MEKAKTARVASATYGNRCALDRTMNAWEAQETSSQWSFPRTVWTVILDAGALSPDERREKLDKLIRSYWRPAYWWLRKTKGCSAEDALDLTQEFFTHFLERDLVSSVAPEKGRFRTFLKVALRNFLVDRHRYESAEKRGGGKRELRLDHIGGEEEPWEPPAGSMTPDKILDLCWRESLVREVLDEVRKTLEAAGKQSYFQLFARVALDTSRRDAPTYRELAGEFSMTPAQVAHRLMYVKHLARIELRKKVKRYVATAGDLESEIHDLFGSANE